MSTDAEKLAQIAALGNDYSPYAQDVAAVLAGPGSTAPFHGNNYRDHVAEAIRLARQRWVGGPDFEFDLALADAVLAMPGQVVTSHGITLTPEEARDAAEALDIAQDSVDDYADQFSDVDARLDEGKTRATAARMRALAARLEAFL